MDVSELNVIIYIYNCNEPYYLMQTEPIHNSEELKQNQQDYNHVPFDGFVNVNDIVKKRRQLRNAAFNVADESYDADLNVQSDENNLQGTD